MTARRHTLANLGPKSQAMLARAGIGSVERMRALGSVQTYLAVKKVWDGASLNLLWAIEGVLTGRRWQDVARTDRLSLLMQLEDATRARG